MGSKVWLGSAGDFYILGLWLADGYWWSSSFGLSSSEPELIKRFGKFLKRIAPDCSLKTRIYRPSKNQKRKKKAVHLYINNRALTRQFLSYKRKKFVIPKIYLPAYLAGRIDGDGSIDRKYRSGISRAARTWVIYLRKHFRERIIPKAKNYSFKLAP